MKIGSRCVGLLALTIAVAGSACGDKEGPCGEFHAAKAGEALTANLKALGTLPAGTIRCAASFGDFVVFPKLDAPQIARAVEQHMVAQGWNVLPLPEAKKKEDFEAATRGQSVDETTLFENPKTGRRAYALTVVRQLPNLSGVYLVDCPSRMWACERVPAPTPAPAAPTP